MAIYHCSVKAVTSGKSAKAKADYIEREGKYKERHDDELTFKASDNMPEFAQAEPSNFWKSSDSFERKNGVRCREVEVALPKELTQDQRHALALDFARDLTEGLGQEKGGKLPFTLAVHDSPTNPHAHIIFAERVTNEKSAGMSEKDYFSRKNPKINHFRQDRQISLEVIRESWAQHANAALERAGHAARIDHRSNAEQGISEAPGLHLGANTYKAKQLHNHETPRLKKHVEQKAAGKLEEALPKFEEAFDNEEQRIDKFTGYAEQIFSLEENKISADIAENKEARERQRIEKALEKAPKIESMKPTDFSLKKDPKLSDLRGDYRQAYNDLKATTAQNQATADGAKGYSVEQQAKFIAAEMLARAALGLVNLATRIINSVLGTNIPKVLTEQQAAKSNIARAQMRYDAAKSAFNDRRSQTNKKLEKSYAAHQDRAERLASARDKADSKLLELNIAKEHREDLIERVAERADNLIPREQLAIKRVERSTTKGFDIAEAETSRFTVLAKRAEIASILRQNDFKLDDFGNIYHGESSTKYGSFDDETRELSSNSGLLNETIAKHADDLKLHRAEVKKDYKSDDFVSALRTQDATISHQASTKLQEMQKAAQARSQSRGMSLG